MWLQIPFLDVRGFAKNTFPGLHRSWELAGVSHSASCMPESNWAKTNLLFTGLVIGRYKLKPFIYEVKKKVKPFLI